MPTLTQNISVKARSLICLAMLSQAGLAFGGFTPLRHDAITPSPTPVAATNPTQESTSSELLDQLNAVTAAVPIVDLAPASGQAAPASVPLPPALETGLSGGAALMLAAGLRKARRVFRRSS